MKATYGLLDNPFDPELKGGLRIGNSPIMVDADDADPELVPQLLDMVCWKLAKLEKNEEVLRSALFGANRSQSAPVWQKNIILLIVGPMGSGRSTLASLICKRVKGSSQPQGKWITFKLVLDQYGPSPPTSEVEEKFAALRSDLKKKFSDGPGLALVLIDHLPGKAFGKVMDVFDAFPSLSRVFIVTSDDEELLTRDFDAAGMLIEPVKMEKLTADDVRAFIAERVPKYLDPTLTLPKSDPDFAFFPFRTSVPDTIVGGSSAPVRAVRVRLWKRIQRHHEELANEPNLVEAARASAAELRDRMIT